MWKALSNPAEVIPLGDSQAHYSGMGCSCVPVLDEGVIVHNAFDMRETAESGVIDRSKLQ